MHTNAASVPFGKSLTDMLTASGEPLRFGLRLWASVGQPRQYLLYLRRFGRLKTAPCLRNLIQLMLQPSLDDATGYVSNR
jgi:hypothetical protein